MQCTTRWFNSNLIWQQGRRVDLVLESDFDILLVVKGVLCVEAGVNLHTISDDLYLFRMDARVYPGHCRLVQERQMHNCLNQIRNALCDNEYGDILLSSALWVDEFRAYEKKQSLGELQHDRAGPSLPHPIDGIYHTDKVIGLRCHCPSILQSWAARSRHWPHPAIVQKVVSLGAFVAPVGWKESEYSHMEWRICFNTGEAELMNNLNDTQAKVYVMLKIILTDIIQPNNKQITSFVLKNIILWQAENTPQKKFYPGSLLNWLHDGLKELRTVIEKKQLRYYMIPERNLMLACGLEDALQSKWVADITDMIEEGPRVILRLVKIRKAVFAFPEPMLWFRNNKMELEMLQVEIMNRMQQCNNENRMTDTDFIMKAIKRRRREIMIEMGRRMVLEGSSSLHDLAKIILM